MPSPPDDPARAMRHRLRNDLQTLSSLARLAGRRAPAEETAAAFPAWLDALAAIYDIPAAGADSAVPLRPVVEGLARRAGGPVRVEGESTISAAALPAVAVGACGVLAFARNAGGPNGDIHLVINGGIRATVPVASGVPNTECPLSLDIAAEALRGRVESFWSGSQLTITFTYPCL